MGATTLPGEQQCLPADAEALLDLACRQELVLQAVRLAPNELAGVAKLQDVVEQPDRDPRELGDR
jgi:hypothetical protein